jgi:hypothetical protein
VTRMLLVALVVFAGCGGQAEVREQRPDLVVRAIVDRSMLESGSELTWTVELDWAPGVSPVIPEFGRELEGLRIVEETLEGPDEIDGRSTQIFHYQLAADRPGSYEIPGVEVAYNDAAGERGSAITESIWVEVTAPLPEGTDAPPVELDEQLRDIVGPQRISDPNVALWLIIAGALLLLTAIVWAWVSRRRWAAPPPPPLPLSAHVVALRDLERLRSAGLLQEGRTQRYAYELSGIFRQYLERRFGFPAVEWTTTEILQGMPEPLRAVRREGDIRQVLDATDLVKYAGREITAGEMEQLADLCEGLVSGTSAGQPDHEDPEESP